MWNIFVEKKKNPTKNSDIHPFCVPSLSFSPSQPPPCSTKSTYTHTDSLQREQLGFIPENKSNNGWKPLKSLIDKKNEWSRYIWSKNKAWSLLLSDPLFRKDLVETNLFVIDVQWVWMTQSTLKNVHKIWF